MTHRLSNPAHLIACLFLLGCVTPAPVVEEPRRPEPEKPAEKKPAAHGLIPIGPDDADPLVDQAIAIAEQGRLEEAMAILQKHVQEVPNALYARMLLAAILRQEGMLDESVAVLMDGLSGYKADYLVWITVGEIHLQQADQGPYMTKKSGMVIFTPNKQDVDEEAYHQEHLELAATALENAFEIDPTSVEATDMLASTKLQMGDIDGAIALYEQLNVLVPDSSEVMTELALALILAGRYEEGIDITNQALSIDPGSSEAHMLLAEFYKKKGDEEKATLHTQQSRFYEWMAPFTTTGYEQQAYDLFLLITGQTGASDEDILEQTEAMAQTDTPMARDILCTIAWHHMHGPMDDLAFDTLTSWKAQDELFDLVEHAQSTCTLRFAFESLAALKAPGLFEILVEHLPMDTGAPFHMDVAGAMDILGDDRAVPHLIDALDPTYVEESTSGSLFDIMGKIGYMDARVRAALALGAFDTDESIAALEQCTSHPDLGAACHAALYRMTESKEHKKALDDLAAEGNAAGDFFIEQYLLDIGTKESKAMAEKWE